LFPDEQLPQAVDEQLPHPEDPPIICGSPPPDLVNNTGIDINRVACCFLHSGHSAISSRSLTLRINSKRYEQSVHLKL